MWLELIAIGVLILLDGYFACAELAIVNTRRSRIKQLVEEKNVQARLVQAFQEDSERFLATTQIGITVAGASAAAMGGVVAIDHLKPVFEAIPLAFVQTWAEPIAVGIVVLIISYFSLVLGELVPKILALKNPERLALLAARPLAWFARVAAWCIRPLALTSRGILRLLGKAAQGEKVFISAEEILLLMQEGQEKGVFDKTEQELIHSVFEFTDMSVREVMVPRPKMCAIAVDMPTPDLLKYIDENKFSRYPVYRKGLNELHRREQILPLSGVPERSQRTAGHPLPERPPESGRGGQAVEPQRVAASRLLRSRSHEGQRAAEGDAAPPHSHGDRGQRIRQRRGAGHAGGSDRGDRRRDPGRVRHRREAGGTPQGRRDPG